MTRPRLVVFTPDFVGGALLEPDGAAVLEQWRDGQLRPVVNRALLRRHLQTLRRLGLPESQLRRWGWWFTGEGRSLLDPGAPAAEVPLAELCDSLAATHSGCCVLRGAWLEAPANARVAWFTAAGFLKAEAANAVAGSAPPGLP